MESSGMEFVTAKEVRFKPKTILPDHVHARPYFCCILKGSYAGKYGSKFQEGGPTETVFRPAGETHSVRFNNEVATHVLVIEFTLSFLRRIAEHRCLPDVSSNFASGNLTWLAKRLWSEYLLGDSCSSLAVEGILLEMLAHVTRQHAPGVQRVPTWLTQVKRQIEESCEQGLSVGVLATTADVHPVYLVTAFKKAFRTTPGEFQRQMRIRKAEQLMSKAPDLPLSEVALATGFFDQSHFSRAFRQVTGFTPSSFRQNCFKA